MHIIIVEDNPIHAERLAAALGNAFPDLTTTTLRNEKEFRGSLEVLATSRPNLVIIDVMLKWTEPSRDREPTPPDVKEGKFHRAGFRCQKLLEGADNTKDIPVILYTVVDLNEYQVERSGLPSNARLLRKEREMEKLFDAIREMTTVKGFIKEAAGAD